MSFPTVSVIIPTYNRRVLVQEAIDSVLAQTFTDYEIIVVDDGSTDGTGEAISARYGDRIRYVWQANQGESVARNRGIRETQSKYIAFLDSDDLWMPNKLSKQIQLLESESDIGLVLSQAWGIDLRGCKLPGRPVGFDIKDSEITFQRLCFGNISAFATTIIRRAVLNLVGDFDEIIQFGEDWDFLLRAVCVAKIDAIAEPLAYVRLHQEGQWRYPKRETVDKVLADHLCILEKAFTSCPYGSPTILNLRVKAIAREYANAAWANYMFDNIEIARSQLGTAVQMYPEVWADHNHLEQVIIESVFLIMEMWPNKPEVFHRYIDSVFGNLPSVLDTFKSQHKHVIARAEIEVGYSMLASGHAKIARSHFLRGIVIDPGLSLDRGMIITLLELYLGDHFVKAIRRLKSLRIASVQS